MIIACFLAVVFVPLGLTAYLGRRSILGYMDGGQRSTDLLLERGPR